MLASHADAYHVVPPRPTPAPRYRSLMNVQLRATTRSQIELMNVETTTDPKSVEQVWPSLSSISRLPVSFADKADRVSRRA